MKPVSENAHEAAASRTVFATAASVRPRTPPVRPGFSVAKDAGKAPIGLTSIGERGQREGGTPPESQIDTAVCAQPVKSVPRTLWPTPGTVTSRPCGKRAAIAAAFVAGVRRSRSPAKTSTGTFGSGPEPIPGRRAWVGQRRQKGAGPRSVAQMPNGPVEPLGSALRADASKPGRCPSGVSGAHGNGPSSQTVAVNSPMLRSPADVIAVCRSS